METSLQIRSLTSKTQINHLGLVEGIYRPDLLPAYPDPTEEDMQVTPFSNGQSTLPLFDVSSDGTIIDDQLPNGNQTLHSIAATNNTEDSYLDDAKALEESSVDLETNTLHSQSLVSQPQALSPLAKYEKDVKAAYVALDYAEGYPTLNGVPFWLQLSFEPTEAFFCFEAYLNLGHIGARQVYKVLEDATIKAWPREIQPSPEELEKLFHTYYWSQRAKAYDMFFAAHRRRERERRALITEDSHYIRGSKMLAIFDEYVEMNKDELIETMTPKAAMEFAKTGMQVQRMSTGLSANGSNSEDSIPAGASLEVIMRSVSGQSQSEDYEGNSQKIAENEVNAQEKRQKLAEIMKDPVLLKNAQELVIRMSQGKQPERAF